MYNPTVLVQALLDAFVVLVSKAKTLRKVNKNTLERVIEAHEKGAHQFH